LRKIFKCAKQTVTKSSDSCIGVVTINCKSNFFPLSKPCPKKLKDVLIFQKCIENN
jgi:hypothetical protein